MWKPLHLQPLYRDARSVGGKVAEQIFEHGLCLPSGSSLSLSDQERIIAVVLDLIAPGTLIRWLVPRPEQPRFAYLLLTHKDPRHVEGLARPDPRPEPGRTDRRAP